MGNLTIGRRRFLQGLGISAATMPLVVGLDSLYVKAQVPTVPKKRFLFMYTPNGMLYYYWRLRLHAQQTDISDGKALASPNLILNPLQPNAKHLLVLDRLSYVSARGEYQQPAVSPDGKEHPGGHQKGIASMLTGQLLTGGAGNVGDAGLANGISLDQVLATKLFAGKTKFPSLEVGVQVDENLNDRYVDKRVSYNKSADPRPPNNDPFDLFDKLFGTAGATDKDKALRKYLDKSVLDTTLDDFARLKPKLSTPDQQLLESHADAVRALEMRLGQVVDCGAVMPLTPPAGVNVTDRKATHDWAMKSDNFETVGNLQMQLVTQALACGLTNVVTFMWSNSECNLIYKWIPGVDWTNSDNKGGHHAMSHSRAVDLQQVDKWYATKFNGFIDQFAAAKESDGQGSLLDNSVLMWASCLSDGAAHESRNAPIVLAGSNGGYFKQGLNVQFNDAYTPAQWDTEPLPPSMGNDLVKPVVDKVRSGDGKAIGSPDLSNQDLCVSILNSFGMEDTTFGDSRFCKGVLPLIKA
jgi:Protein of unknown function (DUF1552)